MLFVLFIAALVRCCSPFLSLFLGSRPSCKSRIFVFGSVDERVVSMNLCQRRVRRRRVPVELCARSLLHASFLKAHMRGRRAQAELDAAVLHKACRECSTG